MDLVAYAHKVFPGSTEIHCDTYVEWRAWLLGRLKALRKPGDLVACIPCQGLGCHRCSEGKVPLGAGEREEHCLEHGLRLACLARYYCPPHRLPWMDQTIDAIAARWTKVSAENKPPF